MTDIIRHDKNISAIPGGMVRLEVIRDMFAAAYRSSQGGDTLELFGISFLADEDHIFGKPDTEYIRREIEWYESMSRNVNDIEGRTPKIWIDIADPAGYVNSNYGHLIYSSRNGDQYRNALDALIRDPSTRQAVMIYTNPQMHTQAFEQGRHDFVCTNTVQYVIRHGKLHAIVQMRSNDAIFGYRNDYAWQKYILESLVSDFTALAGSPTDSGKPLEVGDIIWQVGSLHIYPRHARLVDKFIRTGVHDGNL